MTAESNSPLIIPSAAGGEYIPEFLRVYKDGGVIAYPTETFYGLGVDPYNEEAVEKLYRLKGRPSKKPIPLIISDMLMLLALADEPSPLALAIMERYWPGPLTVIIKAKKGLPERLTAETGTIAVRIPGCPVARSLVEAAGTPLTTTSANPSGMPPATTAQMAADYFKGDKKTAPDGLELIIDGGTLPGGLPSTIIDLSSGTPILVREGQIPFSEIK